MGREDDDDDDVELICGSTVWETRVLTALYTRLLHKFDWKSQRQSPPPTHRVPVRPIREKEKRLSPNSVHMHTVFYYYTAVKKDGIRVGITRMDGWMDGKRVAEKEGRFINASCRPIWDDDVSLPTHRVNRRQSSWWPRYKVTRVKAASGRDWLLTHHQLYTSVVG